jgi:integrase/recombinase XerD
MLTAYRRHTKDCQHRSEGRKYRRCRCPIWVDGTLRGEEVRESMHLRNWDEAQNRVRDLETATSGEVSGSSEPMRLQVAMTDFLADLERRGLVQETIRKYKLLFRELNAFVADKGIRYLCELDVPGLRDFAATWKLGNNTAVKKLERLRAFFHFALDSRWVAENPALKIKNPKVKPRPTLPFSKEEMVRILAACDHYRDSYGRTGQWNGRRLRALVLLLRYSGLRIGDGVALSRARIVGTKLFLYTQKTGTPVYCPLPDFVVTALESLERSNEQYFFWSGTSEKSGAARDYMRYLRRLFQLAKVADGHAHRFRDTFAVELLLAGVPLERVSVLLGHSSVKITEKHYSPWVRARQEQLEADVRRTWAADPVVFAETKGTQEVHEIEEPIN